MKTLEDKIAAQIHLKEQANLMLDDIRQKEYNKKLDAKKEHYGI